MVYFHFQPGEGTFGTTDRAYIWALVSKRGDLFLCSHSLSMMKSIQEHIGEEWPVTIRSKKYGPDLKDRILIKTKIRGLCSEDFYLVGGLPETN